MTAPDPMKSFRGVVVATLVLEGIVVLLALPVVAKLGTGLATGQGILVGALALALFLTCGVAGRPWGIYVALGLQVVMIVCWVSIAALGILGVVFGLVWGLLLWFRHDVAKRYAAAQSVQSAQSAKDGN